MDLHSDLWLDQPDAHDRIEVLRKRGDLDVARAELLHSFVEEGFVRLEIDLDDGFFERFEADVSRAWAERPTDLSVSRWGPDQPMSFADYAGPERPPDCRIPDFHGFSDAALDLYLHPSIFEIIEVLFGQAAIAFQSLYFEYSSSQPLHRDPMFVFTNPTSHLLASWTALEDISEDSGPLAYIPGSHREPWFEFEPGSVVQRPTAPPERIFEWREELAALEQRMPPQVFTARRGETFIWHGGLFHGGSPAADPTLTRKSFVVHYSTADTYRDRTARMRAMCNGEWTTIRGTTNEVIDRGASRGLRSPLADVSGQVGNHADPAPRFGRITPSRAVRGLRRRFSGGPRPN